nr:uncharacterized protein LOC111510828 [Leptinotarsa decemlineata]
MKCLLFCLITFCYAISAAPTLPNIHFGEDGTITVTRADGKKVVFPSSLGSDGYKNIGIELADHVDQTNTIKHKPKFGESGGARYKRSSISITPEESKKGRSESEILHEIFKDYQGAVDPKSYEKVLKQIEEYVKSGDLDLSIYEILKTFAQNDVSNHEDYSGQDRSIYNPSIGYNQKPVHPQNYLNEVVEKQQLWNDDSYGKQFSLESSQAPIWHGNAQWQFYEPNVESFQQYRQSFGPFQNKPIQGGQQYVQQNFLPSFDQYQQQLSQQQIYQPLQSLYQPQLQLYQPQQYFAQIQDQWNSPQFILKQQRAQNPVFLWDQQLPFTQQQEAQFQQVLPQNQRQQNFQEQGWVLPRGQFLQQLPWNQLRQQYYGPQQQYYGPQQQ